jgi:SDR family mycofactocin-dependent oxidoreductase
MSSDEGVDQVGKLDGKVAFITGGARGQGRSHAVTFAREGADIAVLDLCDQIGSVEYAMARPEDLAETVRQVEALGRRVVGIQGDVRDYDTVVGVVERAVSELGSLDIVIANAGIMPTTGEPSTHLAAWDDAIGTMLTGVYYTLKASMAPMIEAGNGGAMVITSSTAGLSGIAYDVDLLNPGEMGYGAAKHGVVGLMRNFARALGPHRIRVNTVHPMGVRTPMLSNEFFAKIVESAPPGWVANAFGLDLVEPEDISNALLWLCSDDARYVTGVTLPIDAGQLVL